jgi:hypothetical protein
MPPGLVEHLMTHKDSLAHRQRFPRRWLMLAVRHYLRPTVRRRIGERQAFFDESIARDGNAYLFSLRLLPVVPFASSMLLPE